MRKGHDRIADKLKLGFELGVFFGQTFLSSTRPIVTQIVRRAQTSRVAAFKVILPKLWKNQRLNKLCQGLKLL